MKHFFLHFFGRGALLTMILLMAMSFCVTAMHAQGFQIPFAKDKNDVVFDKAYVELTKIGGESFSLVGVDLTGVNWGGSVGAIGIVNILKSVLRYIQYVLGGVGIVFFVVAGYRLVVAGGKADEVATQQKQNIIWIIVGFITVTIADIAVNQVFFRDAGEFLRTEESAIAAAREGARQLRRVINFFVAFAGSAAILAIIVAGMRMVMNPGNDETASSQKKVIMWTSLGLVLINLADRIVYVFYSEGGTEGINVAAGLVEITGLANYVLGFLGVVAAASIIYAGILMLVNFGNPDAVGKARTIIIDVMLGIIIAFSAYTIVSAIVQLGS